MKIAFITPFPPYRGGISNYSESLYKELAISNEVRVFNFGSKSFYGWHGKFFGCAIMR